MFFKCFKLNKKSIKNPKKYIKSENNTYVGSGNRIDITQLTVGESAKVIELNDNGEIISKLEAMGIIPGATIRKKSAIPSKGPVILEKDQVQFAISYDMAQRIIVEPDDPGTVL